MHTHQRLTRSITFGILSLLVIMLCPAPQVTYSQDVAWQPRFNHFLRMTFTLPAGFELFPPFRTIYQAGDQRITFDSYTSIADARQLNEKIPLEQFCKNQANRFFEKKSTSFQTDEANICLFTTKGKTDQAVLYFKQAHPTATNLLIIATIITAPDAYLHDIAASVHFVSKISARVYVDEALRLVQSRFIYIDKVDWQSIYTQALARLDDTSSLEDAHDALRWVFEQLNAYDSQSTHTSYYIEPTVASERIQQSSVRSGFSSLALPDKQAAVVTLIYPNSPAEQAGLQVGDRIERVNGIDYADLKGSITGTLELGIRRKNVADLIQITIVPAEISTILPATGRRLQGNIGYVETYGLGIATQSDDVIKYLQAGQDLFRQIDTPAACGWILDVRRNPGGGTIGTLAILAPLRGNGVWFGWRFRVGEDQLFNYKNGLVTDNDEPLADKKLVTRFYPVRRPAMPIAVLISPQTNSGGEYSAFIIQSRPTGKTRIFGEPTHGALRDGVVLTNLFDGAQLQIVDRVSFDAQGNLLPARIEPDVTMQTDYTTYGTDDDPMLQAAHQWLMEQPECKKK